MRASCNIQSSESGNPRRKQIPYLPAVLSIMTGTSESKTARGGMPSVVVRRARLLTIALVLLAGGVLGQPLSASDSAGEAQVPVDKQVTSPAPVADWVGELNNLIYELLQILADAKDDVDDSGTEGPLGAPYASNVQADLDDAASIIDQILDPLQVPCLDPVDAGSVDPSVQPELLSEYAADCEQLAQDAWDAVSSTTGSDETIGTKLKTIESLLAGYREEAGID